MKQYLIIGGSAGIGKAIVKQLSQANHSVIATYNHSEVAELENVIYHQYDVLNNDKSLPALPEVLDGVVYCPGRIQLKPFHRLSAQDFTQDYEVQVLGAIEAIQHALPSLKKAEEPSIVLFSTVAVQTGFTFHSTVAASKGAIEGLTRALAAEFAPKIRVNAIAPSITQTNLSERLLNSEEKIQSNAARHPLNKIGHPSDIASLATFLLSDQSSWMTGQIIHLDGGLSTLK